MLKKTEIAIVGTEFLRDFIDRSMKHLDLGLGYTLYTYETFQDLSDLFKSIPDRIGAVITSGYGPARVLQLSFPDSPRIIKNFNNDDSGIYKLFLRLMNDNRALNLSRVYVDILEASGLNMPEYLYGERAVRYSEALEKYLADKPLAELLVMEQFFADRHLALWRDNRIDLSITRFPSLVLPLQQAGLKVEFVYPGLNHMRLACLDTIQALRLNEMRDYQVAAVCLTARGPAEPGPLWQTQQEQLRQAIRRFGTVGQLDYMLQTLPHGFELLTNRQTLARITDNFHACRFQDFMKNRLSFDVHIGYGLGDTFYQARINAVDANREAIRFPFGASYLIDDHDQLIGPLKSEIKLVISRNIPHQVKLASKKSGLSGLTVQKVLAAVETNADHRVTARELAYKLSITIRSANRFLSSLTEADLAQVVEMRRASTMGRPESVYQITIE